MLYKEQQIRDADAVIAWLTPLVEKAVSQGVTRAEMAAACGASPQAFNGWLKTGRITKANLAKAAAYFGSGPSFAGAPQGAREPLVGSWPFRKFSASQVQALPTHVRNLLEETVAAFLRAAAHATPEPSSHTSTPSRNTLRSAIITVLEEAAARGKTPDPTRIAKAVVDRLDAIAEAERQNSGRTAHKEESSRSPA